MFKINLYPKEYISNHIRTFGYWEKIVTSLIQEIYTKEPDLTFIDIGANIGYFTLLVASYNKKVLAFEPIFKNYELIINSIYKNKFNALVYNIALGSKDSDTEFFVNTSNMGNCSIEQQITIPIKETCKTKTLDYFMTDNKDKLCIKIDVETMEFDVLKGMVNTLKSGCIVYLILEINDNHNDIYKLIEPYFNSYIYIGFDIEDLKAIDMKGKDLCKDLCKDLFIPDFKTTNLDNKKYINKFSDVYSMQDKKQYNLLFFNK